MTKRFNGGRERQLAFLDRRLEELEVQSAAAARDLISTTFVDRRSHRRVELEREVHRLRREHERLDREAQLEHSPFTEDELEDHLRTIERQLRDVLTERDRWLRESLVGARRRQDDFRLLARLKEENERLTAELLRCATTLCRQREAAESPGLKRVWHMLRLSGT